MKGLAIICLSIVITAGVISCNTSSDEYTGPVLTLYGSAGCGHCGYYKMRLDSAHVKYIFKDVEKNKDMLNEMLAVVNKKGKHPYIAYPVIAFDSLVLINPPPDSLLALLGKN